MTISIFARVAGAMIYIGLFGIAPSALGKAGTASNAPSFQFPEDDNLPAYSDHQSTAEPSSSSIAMDAWLNTPLTRLDYILLKIEQRLSSGTDDLIKDFSIYYFDREATSNRNVETDFSARFNEISGRLQINADVEGLGKPKKSMASFCELVLDDVGISYSFEPMGSEWDNNAIDILQRGPRDEFAHAIDKLRKNMVISAQVSATYRDNGVLGFYQVRCAKQSAHGRTTFSKYSARMNE